MPNSRKTSQLQIRVASAEKSAIQRAATRAGLDMSSYVLSCVLAAPARQFQVAVAAVAIGDARQWPASTPHSREISQK